MTHEVTNQPPPLTGGNAWRGDPLLVQLAEDFSEPVRKDLDTLGRFVLTPGGAGACAAGQHRDAEAAARMTGRAGASTSSSSIRPIMR